ncbi:TetR/AcrR family transcriptional regulator [Povalibacter sp.]|uniref:TetR/AcrR family transcriptional regulator n=1 Tax=Povalibacter sp. TaxID=1962978 RepID=UPI002F3F3E22
MKRGALQSGVDPSETRRNGGTVPVSPLRSNGARREQLLNATAKVILEKGVGNLTLDAVCETAHVSKGGLLYYFDGKTALLEALVDILVAQVADAAEQQRCSDADVGVEGARARLRAIACMGELPRSQQLRQVLALICAAYPELAQRSRSKASQRSGQSGTKEMSIDELHLRLLADGLWLADIYECDRITAERRLELLELCGG